MTPTSLARHEMGLHKRAARRLGGSPLTVRGVAWPPGMTGDPEPALTACRAGLVQWAEDHDVKQAGVTPCCLHWMRRGRSRRCHTQDHGGRACAPAHTGSDSWMREPVGWTRYGRPAVITAAVPALTPGMRVHLDEWAHVDQAVRWAVGPAWHPGEAVQITVWRAPVIPDLVPYRGGDQP